MFLSFGIIQSINSHTARDKGVTNVGVWVSLGLNGDTCCLSHSFFVQTLFLPSFPVSFDFILLFVHGYLSQLVVLSVLLFSFFFFFGFSCFFFFLPLVFYVLSFALANKMCALHFFFSLVSFDLNWFLSFKKTIFLFKQ